MRREERVTVQGPVKEQQPDGMSHRGLPKATCTLHFQLSESTAVVTKTWVPLRGVLSAGPLRKAP